MIKCLSGIEKKERVKNAKEKTNRSHCHDLDDGSKSAAKHGLCRES